MKKIINLIKKNIIFITVIILTILSFEIEFPYYIEAPGGLLNTSDRIEIQGYDTMGDFNMTYVTKLKANVISLLIAYVRKDWDIIDKDDVVLSNETEKENEIRSSLLLDESTNNAIILAYQKALFDIKINNTDLYITYIDEQANTDLKIGDRIVSINDTDVETYEDANKIIELLDQEKMKIKVINDDKEYIRYAYKTYFEDQLLIGIVITEYKEIETDPSIKLSFKSYESGPSGGLMMSLSIYYSLMQINPNKSLKIAGTGTIDEYGNVGEISGIKYKLKGAVNEKADIFIVPSGTNYEEAIKEKQKNNYNIDIVAVSTFDEAIEYLKNS